jgi:hypothetical protein
VLGLTAVGLVAAVPASAATVVSQATASALEVSALTVPLIPISSAVNYGTGGTVTSTLSGLLPLLPGETIANTGVYSQTAIANPDGTSAACAGVVGPGGALTLGSGGTCVPTSTSGPAIINLPSVTVGGTGYTLTLTASSIYAVCTAGGAGGPTASSTLANVVLTATPIVFGIPGPSINIPINLNQPVSIPPPLNQVISIAVNQTSTTADSSTATALHIGLGPNSSILSLDLGKVTCGPNALTVNTPMVPAKGAGIAVLTLAVLAGGWYVTRRRRAGQAG